MDDGESAAPGTRLQGRRVLVIGAGCAGHGWGNGKAAAVAYAREGAKLCIVDRDDAALKRTLGALRDEGYEAASHVTDITATGAPEGAVAACAAALGGVDVLHNNVGVAVTGGALDTTPEAWDRAMDVNLRAMFLTIQATIPTMLAQGSGAIVNISSMAGLRWNGYAYLGYAVSKAGVNHLTRMVAMEYASRGIRANAVLPGKVMTPMVTQQIASQYEDEAEMARSRARAVPMQRMGSAWDVARAAVFLASDEAAFITGVCLPVDGGAHCAIPQ